MFQSLRWTFSPTRAVEAYKARKARGGSGALYLLTLTIRIVCAPLYTAYAALVVYGMIRLIYVAPPKEEGLFIFHILVAAIVIAIPLLFVMLLCMRTKARALIYALAFPACFIGLKLGLTPGPTSSTDMGMYLFMLSHFIMLAPFYLFAEEGFSGARPPVFNRRHDNGEWKDSGDDFLDAQLYGSSSASFNMQSFHSSSHND